MHMFDKTCLHFLSPMLMIRSRHIKSFKVKDYSLPGAR